MSPRSRILIVAVYVGRLPAYFPLWLTSCRANPTIDWLVVTDADVSVYDKPDNVHFRAMDLAGLASRFSAACGAEIALTQPYKICDFKPLYGCMADLVEGQWDFWGHCDIDLIFGDLRHFIREDILENYDKIFSVGHFTLYRNTPEINNFYLKEHPEVSWRDILTSPVHFGFDEHIGVNRIWDRHQGRQYVDESVVADVDPSVRYLTISSSLNSRKNYPWQVFAFNDGKVLRYYLAGGRVQSEEFMYIHFQKRKFTLPTPADAQRFFITPDGFVPMDDATPTPAVIRQVVGKQRLTLKEMDYLVRRRVRFLRARLSRRSEAQL